MLGGSLKKTERMNTQRKIQTIAPFLADVFVELEEPIFDLDKYARFLNQNPVNRSVFANITEVWRSLQTTSELTSGLCLENII